MASTVRTPTPLALVARGLGALALAACGLLPSTAALAGPSNPAVPVLQWAPCGAEYPGAECALASVPLDHDDPHGPTTQVALARVAATDRENRIGSLFLNFGGPGGSGVAVVRGPNGAGLERLLQGRFDIIGFDPRGIGRSEQLRCFKSDAERTEYFSRAPSFAYLPEQEFPFFDLYSRFGEHCSGSARITQHMSTADVARDLDLLRQAVGDEKLNYLGFSYGSYVGATYAHLFPDSVRALVIDGVLDPQQWSSGLQIVADRVSTQRVFDEFFRLCDEAGEACALSGPQGAAARYAELERALLSTPLQLGTLNYSYDVLTDEALGSTYAPETWPEFATYFAALAGAVAGEPGALEKALAARAVLADQLEEEGPDETGYNNQGDSFVAVQCADNTLPRSFPLIRSLGEYAARGSRFGPSWWWYHSACAKWPLARDRFAGPWGTRTSAPVLVVGNYFDGATPYDGAVGAQRVLHGSRLLSYAGWGHCAYGRSVCATLAMNTYLIEGKLPEPGTVCPANPNPFLPAPAGAPQLGLQLPLAFPPQP